MRYLLLLVIIAISSCGLLPRTPHGFTLTPPVVVRGQMSTKSDSITSDSLLLIQITSPIILWGLQHWDGELQSFYTELLTTEPPHVQSAVSSTRIGLDANGMFSFWFGPAGWYGALPPLEMDPLSGSALLVGNPNHEVAAYAIHLAPPYEAYALDSLEAESWRTAKEVVVTGFDSGGVRFLSFRVK